MSEGIHLYWLLVWLGIGFGLVEGIALAHHKTVSTFSYSVWVWLGTYSHPKNRWLRLSAFAPFWLVLGLHFAVGLGGRWLMLSAAPLVALVLWSTFVKKER
jgi:hypothetical protein